MFVQDIILDDNFDLLFKNGDLVIAESDEQHLQLIMLLEQGQLRYSPLTGVGITKKIKSLLTQQSQNQTRKNIYLQLTIDGYQAGTSTVSFDNEIIIKAER